MFIVTQRDWEQMYHAKCEELAAAKVFIKALIKALIRYDHRIGGGDNRQGEVKMGHYDDERERDRLQRLEHLTAEKGERAKTAEYWKTRYDKQCADVKRLTAEKGERAKTAEYWKTRYDKQCADVKRLTAELAAAKKYAVKNPLGGPATMFDRIADRIRAGDPVAQVLDDYDLVFIQDKNT